jgi:hypothetical protein
MNSMLHPIFQAALRPFAPAANEPLRHFWVRTSRAADFFPVMGVDRVSVQKLHEGVCTAGEQCIVLTVEEHADRMRKAGGDLYDENSARFREAHEMEVARADRNGWQHG